MRLSEGQRGYFLKIRRSYEGGGTMKMNKIVTESLEELDERRRSEKEESRMSGNPRLGACHGEENYPRDWFVRGMEMKKMIFSPPGSKY